MIHTPRFRTGLLAAMSLALTAGPTISGAHASTVLADRFSYADGNLVQSAGANGGWYSHTGAGIGPIQVFAGTLQVHVAAAYGEDISRAIPLQAVAARTYSSFTVKVLPGSVITETFNGANQPQYIAHFRSGLSDSSTAYRARTALLAARFGGDYTIGIDATTYNQTTQPFVPWGSDLTLGRTYRIVTRYDAATGASTLWVDPIDEASASVQSLAPTAAATQVGFYSLRQGSPGDGTNVIATLDNLGIGSTFADAIVSDPLNAVPALPALGLIALGLAMLAGGGVIIARRRGAAIA